MSIVNIIVITSLALLVLLILLFHFEKRQERRLVLATARGRADIWLVRSEKHLGHLGSHFGAGSLRIALHFIVHNLLNIVLFIINFVEDKLHNLRHHNKTVAKAVVGERKETHLSAIADHKEATALSDTEKENLKHRSLNQQ